MKGETLAALHEGHLLAQRELQHLIAAANELAEAGVSPVAPAAREVGALVNESARRAESAWLALNEAYAQ